MRKITFLFLSVVLSVVTYGQDYAIAGGNFENWATFTSNLNSFGLKDYATQGVGSGYSGSNSLNITGYPTGNDYVFTAFPPSSFPTGTITAITFMVKGTSDAKSLSVNLYKDNTNYYKFNVGTLSSSDVTITSSGSNSYDGTINTGGNWVKVTLDLTGITDYNKTANVNFLALKIGKQSNVALDIDNVEFTSAISGIKNTKMDKLTVTSINGNLIFNAVANSNVEIFSATGQRIYNGKTVEGENSISVNTKGLLMVKVGNSIGKVIM